MKLKKIKIIHFGQLSDLIFDLPSEKLNVFFGENEAGKSTTVAFIKQVMFGFYLRTNSSTFFEDYKPLAQVSPMGGSLFFEAEDGSEYELERLWAKGDKTKKGILTVKKDGQVVPENLFFDQIKNITGEFYADSYIFNQDTLSQVASLSQNDLLERIYYLGASDSSQLLKIRDEFDKEAGKLFKKTGKKPEVNRLLTQFEDQQSNLKATEDEFSDYQKLSLELRNKQDELSKKQKSLSTLQEKKQKLNNLKQQLVSFEKLKQLKNQLTDVKFDQNDYQNAQELVSKIENLQENMSDLQNKISEIQIEDDFDPEQIQSLIQKRPQLLQWQSEEQSYRQKNQELEMEKNQLLQVNSELATSLKLTDDEFSQLLNEYNNLPRIEKDKSMQSDNSRTLSIIGLGLIALAFVLFATKNALLGSLTGVCGIVLAIWGSLKVWQSQQAKNDFNRLMKNSISKQNAFKSKYGFDPDSFDSKNLQSLRGQYQIKENAEKLNNGHLTQINQNLVKLSSRLENTLKQPVSANFDTLIADLSGLDQKLIQYRYKLDRKSNLKAALNTNKTRLKELQLELKAVLAKNDLSSVADFKQLYQKSLKQAEIKTQITALTNNLKDSLNELEQLSQDNAAYAKENAELTKRLAKATQIVNTLHSQVAEIEVKMANLADSNKIYLAKQDLANIESELADASSNYLADFFAAKWINRALDLASNERFPKMINSAREYFKLLTGGHYTDILLAKKINVMRNDGKKLEVKYLSRATAEQLYFALKLAFVEQIKDKINLPILIDDSFVNFDQHRISFIKELLKKLSQKNQVLIFTAQENLAKTVSSTPLRYTRGN